MTKDDFVKWLYPSAKGRQISSTFTIAQAALESGWGASKIGKYNLFGITRGTSWPGPTILVLTHEIFSVPNKKFIAPEKIIKVQDINISGKRKYRYTVYRLFRDYSSMDQALDDHQRILMSDGYKDAWPYRNDAREFARRITDGVGCKYATDPNYLSTIDSLITYVEKSIKQQRL